MSKLLLKRVLAALFLFVLSSHLAQAQSIEISGTVTDAMDGSSLPGVNVVVQGTTIGTVTDIDGKYSISAEMGQIIEISMIGYIKEEIEVSGQTVIDISLIQDITQLDEIVVIGYGTQKKSDLTGSVGVVNTENLEKIKSTSIAKTLQGQTPGVQVFGGGEPGAKQKVQIRGIGSFGNTDPLYVVDGVPISNGTSNGGLTFQNNDAGYGQASPRGGIMDLNPSDIESVQILKDASAAAIYGSRGANGVIIITTKKGKAGKMKITYDGSYGVKEITKRLDFANTAQFQELRNESLTNDGLRLYPANDSTSEFYISPDSIDTDWQEEVFQPGYVTSHSLTVSGGSEKTSYFGSIGYTDETGTIRSENPDPALQGPRYTKYNARLNLNQTEGRFKFGQSLSFSHSDQIKITHQRWNNYLTDMMMSIPIIPVFDTANVGGFGGSDSNTGQTAGNPVAFNSLPEVTSELNRIIGVVWGEIELFQGFSFKTQFSYDRSEWHDQEFLPLYAVGDKFTNTIAKLSEWRGENPYMIWENTLNYARKFGKHDFAAVAGYTAQKDYYEDLYGHKEGYTVPYLKQLGASSEGASALGSRNDHGMISYLGRINYVFNDKYIVTGSIRRDLSSRFGEANKAGNFPSFALGWKLHNEEFFNIPFISQLKFRGGWGKIGNEAIGDYLYETSINNAASYFFGSQIAAGATQTQFVDPTIRWEDRITSNIGVDMALLEGKIEINAEYYSNESQGLLYRTPLPVSSGVEGWSLAAANSASVSNKGIEINVSYRKREGEFHYAISGNVTTLKNEVLDLGKDDTPVSSLTFASGSRIGEPMGYIYAYETEGVFQDPKMINKVVPGDTAIIRGVEYTYNDNGHAYQSKNTQPGDMKYKDQITMDTDGDGVADAKDGVIDADDRVNLGSSIPKATYGINLSADYKGIDVSVFISGVYGNKIFNNPYRILSGMGIQEANFSVESYNERWTWTDLNEDGEYQLGEGTANAKFSRATVIDQNDNNRISDLYVQDGSYLRLQNLTIGYTLPQSIIGRVPGISNLRVYVTGQNLFTATEVWGYDPDYINNGTYDRGYYNGSFPTPRTLLVGVKVGL